MKFGRLSRAGRGTLPALGSPLPAVGVERVAPSLVAVDLDLVEVPDGAATKLRERLGEAGMAAAVGERGLADLQQLGDLVYATEAKRARVRRPLRG